MFFIIILKTIIYLYLNIFHCSVSLDPFFCIHIFDKITTSTLSFVFILYNRYTINCIGKLCRLNYNVNLKIDYINNYLIEDEFILLCDLFYILNSSASVVVLNYIIWIQNIVHSIIESHLIVNNTFE